MDGPSEVFLSSSGLLNPPHGTRSGRKWSFYWKLLALLIMVATSLMILGIRWWPVWPESLDQPEESPKQPVFVQIYLESLCIDSQRYMQQQILPTWQALSTRTPQILALQIIVFGNAHYDDDKTHSTLICQHGEAECDANRYERCAQYITERDIARYLPYIACLFDGRLPMGYRNATFAPDIFASCAQETAIPWSAIIDCYRNQGLVEDLEHNALVATQRTNHTYVPWVTLNGRHLVHDEEETNLLLEIWNAYYGNHSVAGRTNTAIEQQ